MPFDGIAIKCIANELNQLLSGGRVDKIFVPDKEDIILNIRSLGKNYKLLLSANPSLPRCHLTEVTRDNPNVPTGFCMLLRKHLSGGKLINVFQPEMERVLEFEFESKNELGDLLNKKLIIEIMGRHSNIILINHERKIVDSIKHIDNTISSLRMVLPGMTYENPPPQDKLNPLNIGFDEILAKISSQPDGKKVDKILLECFSGLSPLICREIVFNTFKNTDIAMQELMPDDIYELSTNIYDIFKKLRKGEFSPVILLQKDDGKPVDFSAITISQYQDKLICQSVETLSVVLDQFYNEKESHNRIHQRSGDISKTVSNLLERSRRKAEIQKASIKEANERDIYKLYGDLITSNIYSIKRGDRLVQVQNYYDENLSLIEIPLDTDLTPAQNAQKYYSKYAKLKNTAKAAAIQLENSLADIDYFESVQNALMQCDDLREIAEIKAELSVLGYTTLKTAKGKKPKVVASSPAKFMSSDGFEIYVGKNNHQNDFLTLKLAKSHDIWFHTKNIPGSHTIIITNKLNVPDRTLTEAAILAAYHSKARESSNVPVDYTEVKNVKKPSGAKPGMVIYTNNKTLYVTPTADFAIKNV